MRKGRKMHARGKAHARGKDTREGEGYMRGTQDAREGHRTHARGVPTMDGVLLSGRFATEKQGMRGSLIVVGYQRAAPPRAYPGQIDVKKLPPSTPRP